VTATPLDGALGNDDPGSPGVPRLAELRSTFEELRTERRALISRLHKHLDAISSCRQGMRVLMEHRPALPQAESPAFRLQDEYRMTPREAEVAMLLAQGLSNTALAGRLGISPHTARHHTQRVLGKLGVHSRAEAGARLRRV
jgi:DNA-binding CsgD family transcriptional regulator